MMEQSVWREIFTTGMQTGAAASVLQSMNWFAVFGRFLKTMGIRNMQDYLVPGTPNPQVQVMPDAQVAAQAQQGNLAPAGYTEPGVSSDGFPQFPNAAAGNGAPPGR
jgi:hypothetical protein